MVLTIMTPARVTPNSVLQVLLLWEAVLLQALVVQALLLQALILQALFVEALGKPCFRKLEEKLGSQYGPEAAVSKPLGSQLGSQRAPEFPADTPLGSQLGSQRALEIPAHPSLPLDTIENPIVQALFGEYPCIYPSVHNLLRAISAIQAPFGQLQPSAL